MLHTVLYPDSCSAPPWITLTPHLLLQMLLNLKVRGWRGCCWNKLSLVSLACVDAPLPSFTGPVPWFSTSDQSLVASSFTELGSATNTPLAALAAATAAFSSMPQGQAAEEESAGALQKAKVHGGVSSTMAANKLQAAPALHGHSLPIPIPPKSHT